MNCFFFFRMFLGFIVLVTFIDQESYAQSAQKTATIAASTPSPERFIVSGNRIIDLQENKKAVFFHGMGYSPYLTGETPLFGAAPGNDDRYTHHLALLKDLHVNYIHVFPRLMPEKFFQALDDSNLVYGQDVWIWPYEEDFLAKTYQEKTLKDIKEVIDHTYKVGRPDRLVLFSIGDELQAASVTSTDSLHPDVHDYHGKHLSVTHRTPSEVAMAMLIDRAMDYELATYGKRHLYCHTSWTHIGPIANRPDLEVKEQSVLVPDMGDLVCLNIYTYANGVKTSPPGATTKTTYQGYLEQLAAETDKPILISQVGLSTSPIEPKAWVPGFGGHKVSAVPQTFAQVYQDIKTAKGHEKFAGLAFFELQDEWWKSGETPTDSEQHEPEDPEEWFGIYEIGKDNQLVPKGDIPQTIRQLYSEEKE